jgi:thiol-disulfide isomerase/thioredoxin
MLSEEELLLETFTAFNPEIKRSSLGVALHEKFSASLEAKISSMAGSPVKEFTVKKVDGLEFKNSSLSGSPYIVAFSATWCVPCIEFQPQLKSIYEKYRTKGLKVVYFNLDDNLPRWKAMIDRNKLTWINVSEGTKWSESAIARNFHILAVPTYIIVNKEGKIIFNSDYSPTWKKDLEKYIQQVI